MTTKHSVSSWRVSPLAGRAGRLSRTLAAALLMTLLGLLLSACGGGPGGTLRLATTTSTYDSGLLDDLLPDFEESYGVQVEVIAVGTGQALALGERGDADVLLVHDRRREEAFLAAGYAESRAPVMFNDFVLVGPASDPAAIGALDSAAQALRAIAEQQAPFVSRGDQSGTHGREMSLWEAAGLEPDPAAGWYFAIGQGMGAALRFADEKGAYTLTDRGTFLALRDKLPGLVILLGGGQLSENPDPALRNPYGVLVVKAGAGRQVQSELARTFAAWLTSLPTQERIARFGLERYGQPLFYPDSLAWRQARGE